ncbi:RSP_7527 family protein [Bradyrhizobium sp. Ash2021]
MAFYKRRAHRLRAEAIRKTGSALWASLMRIIGWR